MDTDFYFETFIIYTLKQIIIMYNERVSRSESLLVVLFFHCKNKVNAEFISLKKN